MKQALPYILSFLCGIMLLPAIVFLNYEIQKEGDKIVLISSPVYKSSSNSQIAELSGGVEKVFEADEGAQTCARNRWLLKSALKKTIEKGKSIKGDLNIFDLISRGYLKEVPNCPQGGTYSLKEPSEGTVACSVHGETKISS